MKLDSSQSYQQLTNNNTAKRNKPEENKQNNYIFLIVISIFSGIAFYINISNFYIDKYSSRDSTIVKESIKSWKIRSKKNEYVYIDFSKTNVGYLVDIYILKNCNSFQPSNYFNRTDWMLIQEQKIGPDEIIVQLEGSSLQAYVARNEDSCNQYFALFQVPKSGRYRLKITRLRTDYDAIKLVPNFPLMDPDIFIDELIPEILFYYMPEPCRFEVGNGYWISSNDQLSDYPFLMNGACTGNGKTDEERGLENIWTYIKLSERVGQKNVNCSIDVNNFHFLKSTCFYPNSYYAISDLPAINISVIGFQLIIFILIYI